MMEFWERWISQVPRTALLVQRVNQLDAQVLDGEIIRTLQSMFAHAWYRAADSSSEAALGESSDPWSLLPSRTRGWAQLVLESIFYGCTMLRGTPTPGQALQNLKYRDEGSVTSSWMVHVNRAPTTRQKVGWLLLWVVVPRIWQLTGEAAVESLADLRGWFRGRFQKAEPRRGRQGSGNSARPMRDKMWAAAAVNAVRNLLSVARFVNFIIFMRRGVFATLEDRLLQLRLVYDNLDTPPMRISFDFLNRQLLFSEASKLGMALLHIWRYHAMWRYLGKFWTRFWSALSRLLRKSDTYVKLSTNVRSWLRRYLSVFRAGITVPTSDGNDDQIPGCALQSCRNNPAVMPQRASCGCTYCYVCFVTTFPGVGVDRRSHSQQRVVGEEPGREEAEPAPTNPCPVCLARDVSGCESIFLASQANNT